MARSCMFIRLDAVWCLLNLVIALLATAVLLGRLDPTRCSDRALETANSWRLLFCWVLPLLGAGTCFGLRATWPEIKKLRADARASRRRRNTRG
jgi:hypothetical protein